MFILILIVKKAWKEYIKKIYTIYKIFTKKYSYVDNRYSTIDPSIDDNRFLYDYTDVILHY